ncbi:MAG: polysaccharide deacetylase family protein [Gemmatimonadaceae bacterium]
MLLAAGLAAVAGTAAAAAHGAFHRNSPVFGRVMSRLPGKDRAVALTFDDGPNPEATPRILDVLRESRVSATFFLLGKHVERWPRLARRIADEGHTIGNHGYHHGKLHLRGPAYTRMDLCVGTEVIVRTTGQTPRHLRTPHGFRSPWVNAIARELGQRAVGWTLGVWDTDRPGAAAIAERVRRGVRPGSIVLLHDGDACDPEGDRAQTADALTQVIRDLRDSGYRLALLPS